MPTAQKNTTATIPGRAFSSDAATVSFDAGVYQEIALPALNAAQTGTLTTRTDNDTGVATLSTGHGIITSDVVDVYWSGGMRFGMDATVSTNDVTLDGGAGDNLPTTSTAVTVVKQTAIDPLNIDGDAGQFAAVVYLNPTVPAAKAHIDFQESDGTSVAELDLVTEKATGGLSNVVDIAGGETNPYTGNPIAKAAASHNSTTAATILVYFGYDNVT